MTARVSVLALSLVLACHVSADASALSSAEQFAAGVHQRGAGRIRGGEFVRNADGVAPAMVEITAVNGLVIEDGHFRTAAPVDLTRGVELARAKNIALYNKFQPISAGDGTRVGAAESQFNFYSEDEVREIFAAGDRTKIEKAFTSADAKGVAPQGLTEDAVLAALRSAVALDDARTKPAWVLRSRAGDLVVNGGDFDFQSVNQNLLEAAAGKLIWNEGALVSSGGGGDTVLQGNRGIDLIGGRISSAGAIDGAVTPIQYDARRRLDRDRWTLGKYLALVTDGDINIGRPGQAAGPDIRVADGMLKIGSATPADPAKRPASAQYLNLYAGSITLDGEHRSTLLALERGFEVITRVRGGTLNIRSAAHLIGTPIESPSLWNMRTLLEAGQINLDNAQVIGTDNVISGGVVNMRGVSAFYSPRGTLAISGGTVNVGPQAFIGAIKGDSRVRSPYPTAQQDLAITGGELNFKAVAPAPGQPLRLGTHIGGIFAGDNDPAKTNRPTLRLGTGVRINIDTAALAPGNYTVPDFVSVDAGDGSLQIAAPVLIGSASGPYQGVVDTDGRLTLQVR
jgi:hypothetical protein